MSTKQALALFDSLATVELDVMTGAWTGHEFPTGHPLDGALHAFGWHGKRFDSHEHVHPLVFDAGLRRRGCIHVRPAWCLPGLWLLLRSPLLKQPRIAAAVRAGLPLLATRQSGGRLRMTRYRDRTSATLVYDDVPILDVFRRYEEDALLGVMDLKGMPRPYFFVLRRERAPPAR